MRKKWICLAVINIFFALLVTTAWIEGSRVPTPELELRIVYGEYQFPSGPIYE